jgi:hypothetical protein
LNSVHQRKNEELEEKPPLLPDEVARWRYQWLRGKEPDINLLHCQMKSPLTGPGSPRQGVGYNPAPMSDEFSRLWDQKLSDKEPGITLLHCQMMGPLIPRQEAGYNPAPLPDDGTIGSARRSRV